MVARISPQDNAPFISGQIWGKHIEVLVDTGATITILSKNIFECLDIRIQEKLQPVNTALKTASGKSLISLGKMDVPLQIGTIEVNWTCLISEISDDLILGMDFIREHSCLLAMEDGGYLEMRGQKIPFMNHVPHRERCCRIKLATTVVVPGRSEMILSGKVNTRHTPSSTGMIESTTLFQQREELAVARILATNHSGHIPVRVVNFSEEPKTVYGGTTVGLWQSTEDVMSVSPLDYNHEEVEQLRQISSAEEELPAHLQTLWENSKKNLDGNQSRLLKNMLTAKQDVFSKSDTDLGCSERVKHVINTGSAAPIKQAPRRLPQSQMEEAQHHIDSMLEKNIIETSDSPWSSPIVLVKKKDGTTRFCIDYRKLNSVSIKDAYPLPRIDESLDCLAGSKWFSTLDMASGYWQVAMDEEDKRKTAFSTTRSGLYQFKDI